MSQDVTDLSAPSPASLSDPFYYLLNARQVIDWCLRYHSDLLLDQERELLNAFVQLPESAQGLLIRLIMRKGGLFRTDSLDYTEIYAEIGDDLTQAMEPLAQIGLIDPMPVLSLPALTTLCRKAEALSLIRHCDPDNPPPAKNSKQQLIEQAEQLISAASGSETTSPDEKTVNAWWPECPFRLIRVTQRPLFERLRLMFFGNLYQSWSEFVLTELGVQQFEAVSFSPGSRAFQQRYEVDLYLAMHNLQQQLDELRYSPSDKAKAAELTADVAEALETLAEQLMSVEAAISTQIKPSASHTESDWLLRRYQKLSFQIGHFAEKQGMTSLALNCYRKSANDDAVIRRLRLMERTEAPERVYQQAKESLELTDKPEQRLLLNRILQRSGRKAGIKTGKTKAQKITLDEQTLTLHFNPEQNVERQVVEYYQSQGELAFHVESRLINALFALLFWPVLYKPVPGAFFNPFQSGPRDLYRSSFITQRQQEIEDRFRLLQARHQNPEVECYKTAILECYQQKQGIRCSLIHWPAISEQLLELSLDLVPANHLEALFRHLLLDLQHHRKGLPDLVVFNPKQRSYRFVEVKAPNDRLQDHQRLWLEQMQRDGIPAEVLYVQWKDQAEPRSA